MRKKIFVTRQGGIGDVILATPILAELKKLYLDWYITLLVFPNAVEIIKGLPFIDEVFVYNKENVSFLDLWKKMHGYDIALYLDLAYRPAMIGFLAGIPVRVGIEHKRKFWLSRKIKWQEYMDHTYEPYVLGDIVKEGLGINISHENLNRLYIASANETDCYDLDAKLSQNGIKTSEKYIVSSPTTAFYLKNWPLDSWNELYRRLYQNYGIKTVIFGSGNLNYNWDTEAVVDLWGQLNLRQVGELIKDACLLVNSCSLPIHIAAAMETPSVVLYGFTDSRRWAPRERCQIVSLNLPCSPCDGYHGSTCTDPKCMDGMSVDMVYDSCARVIIDLKV